MPYDLSFLLMKCSGHSISIWWVFQVTSVSFYIIVQSNLHLFLVNINLLVNSENVRDSVSYKRQILVFTNIPSS